MSNAYVVLILNLVLTFFSVCHITFGESCTNGAVRLVDGYVANEGRVELCSNGTWGIICTQGWDWTDARVVCKQLGMLGTAGALAISEIQYSGSLSTVITKVNCKGDEETISDCMFNQTEDSGVNYCLPFERGARLICLSDGYAPSFRCTSEGAVRLIGGRKPNEGRVEVCVNGYWESFCGYQSTWNINNARVVCRQLGYTGGTPKVVFGRGANVILDYVQCTGNESRLIECPFVDTTVVGCLDDHAGISCDDPACDNGSIRLVGGSSINGTRGTVEICKDGSWGTICHDGWNDTEAKVVCRQLGFEGGTAVSGANYGQGSGSVLTSNVQCNGDEQSLTNCNIPYTLSSSCTISDHSKDAGVECYEPCVTGAVRLVNGLTKYEGRVEYCNDDEIWGTIHEDNWDTRDTVVVCRQLGYEGSLSFEKAYFGQGIGVFSLVDVSCAGTENSLAQCTAVAPSNSRLSHNEDISVICLPLPPCPCKDRMLMTVCQYYKEQGDELLPRPCHNVL